MTRYIEHRAWGLDSAIEDRHWLLEISCRFAIPDWFDVVGQAVSRENQRALDLCASCLHGGIGTGGKCEAAARAPNLATHAYRTDGVIMAGAVWRNGVPYIPSRCSRCNRPYLWRWQAGGVPDHRCPAPPQPKPDPTAWNVLAA